MFLLLPCGPLHETGCIKEGVYNEEECIPETNQSIHCQETQVKVLTDAVDD